MKLLKPLIVVVIVIALVAYLGTSTFLGGVVKKGVETFGPKITQTAVTLDSASVRPLTGSGALKGLTIGNPEGFKTERAMYLGYAEMSLDPFSVLSERVIIKKIHISEAEFTYERKLLGSNIGKLLDNIEESASAEEEVTVEETGKEEEPSEPKKFEIHELVIDNSSVQVAAAGKGVTIPLPEVNLQNLGVDKGGITADELTLEIMNAVNKKLLEAASQAGGAAVSGAAAGAEGAVNTVQEEGGKAIDAVKGLFE